MQEFPEKCGKCAKSESFIIHSRCDFCERVDFDESVLCDLTRSAQKSHDFLCKAFQPILKLASTSESDEVSHIQRRQKGRSPEKQLQGILDSEKFKYQRAIALQNLSRDPDLISINLKYHYVWNVVQRRQLFTPEKDYFDFLHDIFMRCWELVGGYSTLIWLAPDHLHVFIESDGEQSPETIVKKMKRFSKEEIMKKFPELKERISPEMEIWDEAYFVETMT